MTNGEKYKGAKERAEAFCEKCGYRTMECHNHEAAIAAHNRVARAVAKEKEANDANA